MSAQLPLNISLRDSASFENYSSGKNQEPIKGLTSIVDDYIRKSAGDWFVYLWGGDGCGKTHLLEAVCRYAEQAGATGFVISLMEKSELMPSMLAELEHVSVVCIDDVQNIAGSREWETALFNLCEQRRADKQLLVISGDNNPKYVGLALPDLQTRLAGWGLVYQLQGLEDDEKLTVIKKRARNRGIDVTDEVVRYVLNRYPRDMQALFRLLEKVDHESLANQRKVTIPFLRTLDIDITS
jgi:DnaA-homolog protein